MSELLPCPFCGGKAKLQTDKGPTGELYGWVGCNTCDAMSTHCDLRSMQPEEIHPIAAWNTRQPDQAAMIEGARRMRAAAANVCGSLAETTYDDADGFEAATGCEAAILALDPAQIIGEES